MTLPPRISHASALRDARQILAGGHGPRLPAVRMARAYVRLHEETTRVLRGVVEKVDRVLAEEGGANA